MPSNRRCRVVPHSPRPGPRRGPGPAEPWRAQALVRTGSRRLAGTLVVVVLALACGSDGPEAAAPTDGPLAGAPDWVLGDCSAHWADDGARLCGVGSVAGTRNISLARTAAIGRARTGIAATLQERVRGMLEGFASTKTGREALGDDAGDSGYMDDVARQITQLTLSSASLEDTWVGPDGTLYTLVALDAETFGDAVDQMSSLAKPIREAVKVRADDAFREREAPAGQ